ncbi:hypothetical protein LZC95_52575 [Pendulispora brunnea]|uniref:Carboxypeptidase regulatory-like domain-containing protein n=1 Tax=Pendulispora brunnea TaxID=2905690 RepID=A0ABZ2KFA9_9BACT
MRLFSKVLGLAGALAAAGLAGWACSAPDPGELGGSDPGKTPGGNKFDAGPGPGSNDSGTGGDTGGNPSPNSAFLEAPAYTATEGDSTVKNTHANPAGENCVRSGCHAPGNGTGPGFIIGGTIYKDRDGLNPVGAGVEVRIRAPNGKAVNTYTDQLGNFRIRADKDPAFAQIPQDSKIGVRAGTATANIQLMNQTINGAGETSGGSCQRSGCHSGGGAPNQPKIWVTVP